MHSTKVPMKFTIPNSTKESKKLIHIPIASLTKPKQIFSSFSQNEVGRRVFRFRFLDKSKRREARESPHTPVNLHIHTGRKRIYAKECSVTLTTQREWEVFHCCFVEYVYSNTHSVYVFECFLRYVRAMITKR